MIIVSDTKSVVDLSSRPNALVLLECPLDFLPSKGICALVEEKSISELPEAFVSLVGRTGSLTVVSVKEAEVTAGLLSIWHCLL